MSTYFGNNSSSYQKQGGYYYQPYQDNGPYAQILKATGETVGSQAGTIAGLTGGVQVIVNMIGRSIGGSAGELSGFYMDNFSAASKNFDTFIQETNNPSSWIAPSPIGD